MNTPAPGRTPPPGHPAPPVAATILAAGLGQRLGGRPKAALQIDGHSLLARLAAALRGAGIGPVSVVIGPYADRLVPLVAGCGARAVRHPQPGASLVASQRLALQAHRDALPGHDLLLVLADLPLLGAEDIAPLLAAWARRAPGVHAQVPVVDGVRGHPLLLSSQAVAQVQATPRHLGIRDWLCDHPGAVVLLESARRAYVSDLDTPDDLHALQALLHPAVVGWPAP